MRKFPYKLISIFCVQFFLPLIVEKFQLRLFTQCFTNPSKYVVFNIFDVEISQVPEFSIVLIPEIFECEIFAKL